MVPELSEAWPCGAPQGREGTGACRAAEQADHGRARIVAEQPGRAQKQVGNFDAVEQPPLLHHERRTGIAAPGHPQHPVTPAQL
jgi:hypothetical protein